MNFDSCQKRKGAEHLSQMLTCLNFAMLLLFPQNDCLHHITFSENFCTISLNWYNKYA